MMVRLAIWYRTLMVLLVPVTFGIGTLVLWLYARQWPKRADADGILDRRGRSIPWKSIQQIAALRTGWDGSQPDPGGSISITAAVIAVFTLARCATARRSRGRSSSTSNNRVRARRIRKADGSVRLSASDLPNPMIAAAEVG